MFEGCCGEARIAEHTPEGFEQVHCKFVFAFGLCSRGDGFCAPQTNPLRDEHVPSPGPAASVMITEAMAMKCGELKARNHAVKREPVEPEEVWYAKPGTKVI